MKCDLCHEPGKKFRMIGPLDKPIQSCEKCKGRAWAQVLEAEKNARALSHCADYLVSTDEGAE